MSENDLLSLYAMLFHRRERLYREYLTARMQRNEFASSAACGKLRALDKAALKVAGRLVKIYEEKGAIG